MGLTAAILLAEELGRARGGGRGQGQLLHAAPIPVATREPLGERADTFPSTEDGALKKAGLRVWQEFPHRATESISAPRQPLTLNSQD